MRLFILVVSLIQFQASVVTAEEAPPSVKEILRHADRARGNVEGIAWNVKVTTKDDDSSATREMEVKARDNDSLVRFLNPPKMKNQMILMKDRIMWFIRPGLSKPVTISPRQKLTGNAANGDIAATNYVNDYEAVYLGAEENKGEECYILDLKATNRHVTYDRIKYWVSKKRLVGVKAEFYTVSGKLFKTAELKYDNRLKINDETTIPFVSELIISDAVMTGEVTSLVYSKIRQEKLPASLFNLDILIR